MSRGIRLSSHTRGKLFEFMFAVSNDYTEADLREVRNICFDSVACVTIEDWQHK